VEWKRGSALQSDAGPGILFSSGLVAGGSILGLAASGLAAPDAEKWARLLAFGGERLPEGLGFLLFLGLAYLIYRTALKAKPA
jgi:hypothetical protein